MKPVDPNYQPPEQSFDVFPDGTVKVKGFEWFSLDEGQKPILAAQKDGKLVGRLRFTLLDGEEGPPMSVTLAEMNLLAKAFGCKNLPTVPSEAYAGLITKFMIDIRNMCQDKVLEVEVKKGWVNSIPGTEVPEGTYWFDITDISSPEKDDKGNPKPKLGDFGYFFFVTFTVDSEKGHPSPYKGANFTEIMPYAIVVNDKGEAEFETVKEGKYAGQITSEATRLNKLMMLGAPDTFAQEFTPPNPHNLLPFMKQKFLEARRMLEGQRVLIEKKVKGKMTRRIGLSWPGLKAVEGYEAPKQVIDKGYEGPKRIIESMGVEEKVRQVLVEAFTKKAGQPVVVNGSYELTEAGRKVAKEIISPLKNEGLVEKKHQSLEELTVEEITKILESMGPDYNDLKEKVVALGVGFEIVKLEEPEEDSPF